MDPHDVQVLRDRAATKFTLLDFESALADFNRALQLVPEHPANRTSRGSTFCMLRKLEAALADLDKANRPAAQ